MKNLLPLLLLLIGVSTFVSAQSVCLIQPNPATAVGTFEDEDVPINIDGPKSYYEAFTDLQGIMYYLIYVSIVIGKSVNSLFDIEYQFIKNQAHKLNDVFKLDSWKNNEDNILKKTVKQLSPAFSYYIIKYLIMKKIIDTNNYDLLNNPKDLIKEIFKIGFQTGGFTNIRSSRMTLIQMF